MCPWHSLMMCGIWTCLPDRMPAHRGRSDEHESLRVMNIGRADESRCIPRFPDLTLELVVDNAGECADDTTGVSRMVRLCKASSGDSIDDVVATVAAGKVMVDDTAGDETSMPSLLRISRIHVSTRLRESANPLSCCGVSDNALSFSRVLDMLVSRARRRSSCPTAATVPAQSSIRL